jgi:hypothetical protein
MLLGSTAALAACATTTSPVAVAGDVCGTYGYVDVNNDGFISGDEWNTYRTSTYGSWDVNRDGRISRREFERCYIRLARDQEEYLETLKRRIAHLDEKLARADQP